MWEISKLQLFEITVILLFLLFWYDDNKKTFLEEHFAHFGFYQG